ncbi:MAG: ATP-binding protein [Candidatus Peribacteraceae bacterium]|nr:ATP-binding protein [Candidatus Peribacteraceae bacterium]
MTVSNILRGPETANGSNDPKTKRYHAVLLAAAYILFVACVIVSIAASQFAASSERARTHAEFQQQARGIQNLIQERLQAHVNALLGAQGLFAAGTRIDRPSWSSFVRGLTAHGRYPALTSMAYLENITASQRPLFEQIVRADTSLNPGGYPQFAVRPEGARDRSVVITYLEPEAGREDLLGFDLAYSHLALLDDVRDKGELASLGRLAVSRIGREYLLVLPLYRSGAPQDTVPERRSAFIGYAAETLSPAQLFQDRTNLPLAEMQDVFLELKDVQGEVIFQESDLMGIGVDVNDSNRFTEDFPLHAGGLSWVLTVSVPDTFGLTPALQKEPLLVLLGGLAFSLLIFALLYEAANARHRAMILAGKMTGELGKFQLAVKYASNHIIITDPDGKILYTNPSTERITGYTRTEIIGQTARIWGGRMPPEYYRRLWQIIKKERKPFDGELTNRRKDGTEYEAVVHISPILDRSGQLYGFVGIEEDITQQKVLERARSEFVSLASHQLRTPLTAIRLTLETLRSGVVGSLAEAQQEMISRAAEYAVRMADTIHTMLTVSRVETGTLSIVRDSVSLASMFEDLRREQEPVFSRKHQQVTLNCPSDLSIRTDAKVLWEILSNLVSNAIAYTPDGGLITMRAAAEGNRVCIEVADTGYGIPSGEQERIFQKFFRATNAMQKKTSGTGLGLYLVRSLTTLLGGEIAFTSVEHQGTTFTIHLSLNPPFHEQEHSDR